jgi:hypothetical protein
VIDSLARRLNVRLTHSRGADMADVSVNVGNTSARVTLYKSGKTLIWVNHRPFINLRQAPT